MDERLYTGKNINYKCVVRRSDGSEEDLSDNLTFEELIAFLKNYEGRIEHIDVEHGDGETSFNDREEIYNLTSNEDAPSDSSDENLDVENEGQEEQDEYSDDEERCPICGSTDIVELDRGKLVGSIAGGILGFNKRRIVKSFLPDFASRGVGEVIGYAVGYAAGKVLDKKVLNNRKCAHCGYEWHEDEDIF